MATDSSATSETAGLTPELRAEIDAVMGRLLADPASDLKGLEADIVRGFIESHGCGKYDPETACGPGDVVLREFPLRYGRADIVIFHADGTATVIEAKDGSRGYAHVVAGIGQASLYATQLMMLKGSVKRVRKCLMWSSTGDLALDAVISIACEFAGTTPLSLPTMRVMMAASAAVHAVMGREEQPA